MLRTGKEEQEGEVAWNGMEEGAAVAKEAGVEEEPEVVAAEIMTCASAANRLAIGIETVRIVTRSDRVMVVEKEEVVEGLLAV